MQYVVIIYLWLAILMYLVLGGADFGAGILELFTSPKNKRHFSRTAYHAIGPIWEANHMWLIIAIVILFVGFPEIYTRLSIHLHIPLVIMLTGIIARGTSFTFKHYDAVKDDTQRWYNSIFLGASFITPLFLGIIAASTISGQIDVTATTYMTAYVYSWLNWFSIAVGFFTAGLCGYLASVYLIGEADSEQDKRLFIRSAKRMSIASIILGAFVFVAAAVDNVPLVQWIFEEPVDVVAILLASISLGIQWYSIAKDKIKLIRVYAGFQVTMILLAANYAHFPDFLITRHGNNFSLIENIASSKTVLTLGWALLIGSVLILPFLFYLFYSFERRRVNNDVE